MPRGAALLLLLRPLRRLRQLQLVELAVQVCAGSFCRHCPLPQHGALFCRHVVRVLQGVAVGVSGCHGQGGRGGFDKHARFGHRQTRCKFRGSRLCLHSFHVPLPGPVVAMRPLLLLLALGLLARRGGGGGRLKREYDQTPPQAWSHASHAGTPRSTNLPCKPLPKQGCKGDVELDASWDAVGQPSLSRR